MSVGYYTLNSNQFVCCKVFVEQIEKDLQNLQWCKNMESRNTELEQELQLLGKDIREW